MCKNQKFPCIPSYPAAETAGYEGITKSFFATRLGELDDCRERKRSAIGSPVEYAFCGFNKSRYFSLGVLKKRQRTIHYIDKPFFAYRGLLRCPCGRVYSPYPQKGINYYNSRCKEGCDNPQPNMRETDVTGAIQKIIGQIHFTDEELAELEAEAKTGIQKVSDIQDRELKALHERQRKLAADLSYMAQNRITLLRTGTMTPEELRADEERTKAEMEHVEAEIVARGASAREMLDYTIRFSELVKNAV